MLFAIPNTKVVARIFEPVQTVDEQYDIVDVGVQYECGGIDSLAVGGSFHTLKTAVQKNNASIEAEPSTPKSAPSAPVAPVAPKEPVPVTNYDGVEQDIAGL